MKKTFFILALASILFSCSKDEELTAEEMHTLTSYSEPPTD
ncbi:hypothetical protein [Labilibaculum euxinus]|nr:hypothetical protein [Labilibaculum euxinus]MDQ1772177.1 hypothetical protein [Labilibaculum euxinus]